MYKTRNFVGLIRSAIFLYTVQRLVYRIRIMWTTSY